MRLVKAAHRSRSDLPPLIGFWEMLPFGRQHALIWIGETALPVHQARARSGGARSSCAYMRFHCSLRAEYW